MCILTVRTPDSKLTTSVENGPLYFFTAPWGTKMDRSSPGDVATFRRGIPLSPYPQATRGLFGYVL